MGVYLTMGGAAVASVDDLLAVMHRHLAAFDRAGDHRAAFLRVYATMTASVREQVQRGGFLDPDWIREVTLRFAWWYFDALDRGDQAPPAWACAFAVARRREGFALQDILLGINAHINNDLPLVVAAMLEREDPRDPLAWYRRRFDHDQINRILARIIPTVEAVIARHDARWIRTLGRVAGRLDQTMATFGLIHWRDNVWKNALLLRAAASEAERQTVIRSIQEDAHHVAEAIRTFPLLRPFRRLAPLTRRWRLF
jgi:hypothetical protein